MQDDHLPANESSDFLRRLQSRRKTGGQPVDRQRLAEYLAGRAPPDERRAVEELSATYRDWDQACLEMRLAAAAAHPIHAVSWDDLRDDADADQSEGRPRPGIDADRRIDPARRALWLQAACLLLAVGGLGWGLTEYGARRSARRELALLSHELRDSRLELALNLKQEFAQNAQSVVDPYWNMSTSPKVLDPTRPRGDDTPPPEAVAAADRARKVLEELARPPHADREALLELAALNLATGRLVAADAALRQAAAAWADAPEVATLRALWHLAMRPADVAEAERLLRQATQTHPEYLPAWYNLALLLGDNHRDRESREAWQQYLSRENRPEYRQIAEGYLRALRND